MRVIINNDPVMKMSETPASVDDWYRRIPGVQGAKLYLLCHRRRVNIFFLEIIWIETRPVKVKSYE